MSSLLRSLQICPLAVLALKPSRLESALPQPYLMLVFYPATIIPPSLPMFPSQDAFFREVQVPAWGVQYCVLRTTDSARYLCKLLLRERMLWLSERKVLRAFWWRGLTEIKYTRHLG